MIIKVFQDTNTIVLLVINVTPLEIPMASCYAGSIPSKEKIKPNMMRYPLMLLLFCCWFNLSGQTQTEANGAVSYVTSQSVYVKFPSTKGIKTGDTLFTKMGGKSEPALKVRQISSTSCVCDKIGSGELKVSDKVFANLTMNSETVADAPSAIPVTQPADSPTIDTLKIDTTNIDRHTPTVPSRQQINGFLSIASYSAFSNSPVANAQRFQYNLSFTGKNFGNTGLSAECYLSFYQKPSEWSEVQANIFNALKIYSLNVSYEFNRHFKLLVGRKINPLISNLGANDGLQFEMNFKPISVGIIAGSRPDYRDYSFNFNLLQYGGYVAHEAKTKNGPIQTTLAFIQQTNSGKTDRRFAYLQHNNAVIPNVNFFGSVEVDLFRLNYNTQDSTFTPSNSPTLSNLYLSLRWRIIKQLSVSLSYSNRNNIVYYETNKSYLEQLLEYETTQGYLFNMTLRPVNKLTFGATVGYRFQKSDPRPSRNVNAYLTYSQIPAIGITATVTATLLESSYIKGQVYGFGISRDLIAGKLYAALNYRYTDYSFTGAEANQLQNVGEVNLSWRILRKLSFSVYFEGTFETVYNFQRVYMQITQRL